MTKKLKKSLRQLVGKDWKSKSYLLAVSGGVDSTVLLHLCTKLLPKSQIRVAHFDHRVRKDSSNDAVLVAKMCRGVQFHLGKRQGKKLSEDALRQERWEFLHTTQTKSSTDFIVTGHHLEDQLETILMRLIRGTGLTGLSGIRPRNGKIIRPLLKVSKTRLEAYATRKKISFITDETNLSPQFFRNRIRHELSPVLFRLAEQHGGKKAFLSRLKDLTQELQDSSAYIRSVATLQLDALSVATPYWTRFARQGFLKEEKIIQTEMLRILFHRGGLATPSRKKTEEILRAFRKEKSISATEKAEFTYSCEMIYFTTLRQRRLAGQLKKPTVKQNAVSYENLGVKLEGPGPDLTARYFQPGDKYQGKKLKKILLEMRIPSPERALIPVIEGKTRGEILWHLGSKPRGFRVLESQFPFTNLSPTFH